MKNRNRVLLCIIISLISCISYGDNKTNLSAREYVLDLLKMYSPEGYEILHSYNSEVPAKRRTDFMDYVRTIDDDEITSTINTVVHEICHGYTSAFGTTMAKKEGIRETCYYLYINSDDAHLVELTTTFPSKKMKDQFSEDLRTFRFSYIDTSETTLSTQSHGIYGLLDEWNAYTQGTKAAFSLHPYFMTKDEMEHIGSFFAGINGTLYGILEFKFFILQYLLYAKKYENKIYKGIMKNDTFNIAFQKINRESRLFIAEYFKKRMEFYSILESNGLIVRESEEYLFIGEDVFTSTGYSNFFDVYTTLALEMEKSSYQSLIKELGVDDKEIHYPVVQLYEGGTQSDESDPGFSMEELLSEGKEDSSLFYEESDMYREEESTEGGAKSSHPLLPVPGNQETVIEFTDQKDSVSIKWTDITSCSVEFTQDFIFLTMNLADLPLTLTINHSFLSPFVLEYQWSFEIDVDNDDAIELICSASHAKEKGKKQSTALINEVMDQAVYRARLKTLEYLRIPYTVSFSDTKIIFRLERNSHKLISEMEDGFQISFSAFFYNGEDYAADEVNIKQ